MNNCTDCILDMTDACPRGSGRAIDDEICDSFISNKNESWQLGYHQGITDAEAEHNAMCESCIHKVSKEDIDQIRKDAIDECIKTIINYCSGLPNGVYINTLEKLKEQSNDTD